MSSEFSFVDQVNNNSGKLQDNITSTNIFSTVTNTRDIMDQTKSVLFSGEDCRKNSRTMGDKYFVQSGVCGSSSVVECRGSPRYLYIDNIPKPYYPCVDPNQPIDSNCAKNKMTGLIPGIIQDVVSINPFEFIYSSSGKGSIVNDRCIRRTEEVGYQDWNGNREFVKQTRCSPEPKPLICSLETFEDTTDSIIEYIPILIILTLLFLVSGNWLIILFSLVLLVYGVKRLRTTLNRE
jgi:hypothetical protein